MKDGLHSEVRAKNRRQIKNVYKDMEIKRDIHNQMMYDRVQSMYSAFYGGIDPRRKSEIADAGMVEEDSRAMANLSPTPIHRQYPRAGYYSNPYIDDSTKE